MPQQVVHKSTVLLCKKKLLAQQSDFWDFKHWQGTGILNHSLWYKSENLPTQKQYDYQVTCLLRQKFYDENLNQIMPLSLVPKLP